MVSSSMGVGSFVNYEEIIDVEPVNFRKLKKTVPSNGGWEERTFYEVRPASISTLDWLHNNYGGHSYQNTWWSTHNSIVMRDKIYTHWKLCQ